MNPQQLCEYLNDLLAIDQEAIQQLFERRVPCNQALADHSAVQVGVVPSGFIVGILGILNGMYCPWPDNHGRICAEYEEEKLLGFCATDGALHQGDGK